MKYYTVVLDGIDKTGKDLIAGYIWRLDKRLLVNVRGWPSLYAYNIKYDRKTKYDLPSKRALYVHLVANKTDWQIRCDITNEPKIDYDYESGLFNDAFAKLKSKCYNVVTFNTSANTPYYIAKCIIDEIVRLNKRSNKR